VLLGVQELQHHLLVVVHHHQVVLVHHHHQVEVVQHHHQVEVEQALATTLRVTHHPVPHHCWAMLVVPQFRAQRPTITRCCQWEVASVAEHISLGLLRQDLARNRTTLSKLGAVQRLQSFTTPKEERTSASLRNVWHTSAASNSRGFQATLTMVSLDLVVVTRMIIISIEASVVCIQHLVVTPRKWEMSLRMASMVNGKTIL